MLPYCDDSLQALLTAQRTGTLQPVPRGSRVPRGLRGVLLRGLSLRSDERWPSMEALLAALERLRQPRRWPVAATLVVGFGAGAVVFMRAPEPGPCDAPRDALEGTWGAADRRAVEAAYLASGHEEAPRLFERVRAELDAYTNAWVSMHEESCRATYVRHEQPEAEFEQGMRCLQRHHGRRGRAPLPGAPSPSFETSRPGRRGCCLCRSGLSHADCGDGCGFCCGAGIRPGENRVRCGRPVRVFDRRDSDQSL